jgi:hypothetical protein
MKTLLSGNSAVAMFHHENEHGKHFTRLHIYNKQNQEWVYNSFILVNSDEPGFDIRDVEINGNRAILHIVTNFFEGQIIFQKKGDTWEYQHRFKNGGQNNGDRFHSRPWLQKLYHFLGLPGSVSIPAAQ